MSKVRIGQVVKSIAGRDKGNHLLINSINGNQYVTVVDGHHRKIENPKKKKLKHLQLTQKVAVEFENNIQAGLIPTNSEIKAYLKELIGSR